MDHAPYQMSDDLRDYVSIESPEAVDLRLEVAGLGSRFLAYLLDWIIQFLVLAGVGLVAAIIFALGAGAGLASPPTQMAVILFVVGLFVVRFGYYILFELMRNGQTPGKREVGIRVVRDGGYPVTTYSSVIRNLLRIAEDLPVVNMVSASLIAFTRSHKRIGDLAAGTVVVRERAQAVPGLRVAPAASAETGESALLTTIELAALSDQDFHVVERFLQRRAELTKAARDQLSQQLGTQLATKIGRPLSDYSPAGCEAFLEQIARSLRSRPI